MSLNFEKFNYVFIYRYNLQAQLHDWQQPQISSMLQFQIFKTEIISVSVVTPPLTTCLSTPTVITTPSGSIASVTTAESRYGSDSCPWVIQADPGQSVNLTLMDFSSLEVVTVMSSLLLGRVAADTLSLYG